jgi:hypothetical protein
MDALDTPTAAAPILFGAPAPPGDLLPWSWAEQRLAAARTYWIATTRRDGRPHCRPVWGVWLPDGFWFSTGSLARHNLLANPEITVHLESGTEVVAVEAVATAVTGVSSACHRDPIACRDQRAAPASSGVNRCTHRNTLTWSTCTPRSASSSSMSR